MEGQVLLAKIRGHAAGIPGNENAHDIANRVVAKTGVADRVLSQQWPAINQRPKPGVANAESMGGR
jgi:hypothetical protein